MLKTFSNFIKSQNKIIILVLILPLLLSMNFPLENKILTQEDWDEERNQTVPGAQSPYPFSKLYWESYNEWQCFYTTDIKFNCQYFYDNGDKEDRSLANLMWAPAVVYQDGNHVTSIEYHESIHIDRNPIGSAQYCKKMIDQWKENFENEDVICTYGAGIKAPVPDYEYPGYQVQIRLLDRIKSKNFLWESPD